MRSIFRSVEHNTGYVSYIPTRQLPALTSQKGLFPRSSKTLKGGPPGALLQPMVWVLEATSYLTSAGSSVTSTRACSGPVG